MRSLLRFSASFGGAGVGQRFLLELVEIGGDLRKLRREGDEIVVCAGDLVRSFLHLVDVAGSAAHEPPGEHENDDGPDGDADAGGVERAVAQVEFSLIIHRHDLDDDIKKPAADDQRCRPEGALAQIAAKEHARPAADVVIRSHSQSPRRF